MFRDLLSRLSRSEIAPRRSDDPRFQPGSGHPGQGQPNLLRSAVVFLLLFGVGSAYAAPAVARTARAPGVDVDMSVTPYLGGHVKYGEWLPLRVDLVNAGSDLVAEVRAEVASSSGQAVYAAPVPLPAGARKQVDLYILPPSFAEAVVVRLVQDDQVWAESEVDISSHPQNEYLVGVVAPDTDAFAPLNGLALAGRTQTRLIALALDELPKRAESLRTLDCLVLTGVDTTGLTPAQGEALRAWVELGGRLLVGGGVGARRTLGGLPDALRPIQLAGTVELNTLDELVDFAGEPVQVPGPFPITPPIDHQGRAIVSQDEHPLLVQQSLGGGWVAYLALDPSASPFDAWAGTLSFWRKLLEPGSALPINSPSDIPRRVLEAEQMTYALSNLPALDLPSIRWLGMLFGLYVLLVGPANYLLLRRWRRLDWGWLTIPALTLAFSLIGYGLGYRLRGGDVIVSQISIVPLTPGDSSSAIRSYVGIFSPSREAYTVQVGGDALVSPLSYDPARWGGTPGSYDTLNILQGDPALVRGLGVNQWSMQTFQAETWQEAGEPTIDANLTIEGDRVQGTIRNRLERPLQEMILLSGHRYVRLGELGTGQEREIEATLQSDNRGMPFPWVLFEELHQISSQPPREAQLRQSILEAYFQTDWGTPAPPPADLTLLAWTDHSPIEVQVADTRANRLQTTLVVARLPLSIVDGRASLPLGTLSGQLVEIEGMAGECGPAGQIHLAQGRAVLEYQLPLSLRDLVPTSLTIQAGPEGGGIGALPSLYLYDWAAGDWVQMEGIESGHRYDVPDPGRFIGPGDGAIRLQAQHDNAQGSCYRFDLGLEASSQ
jgi:hypothetical protein